MKNSKKILIFLCMLVVFSGCESRKNQGLESQNTETALEKDRQATKEDSEKLAEGYRNLYEDAVKSGRQDGLELKQEIINYFKEQGYPAVDNENQIDMVNAKQVEKFCAAAGEKQTAEITLFSVADAGGFIRRHMKTENGEIHVTVSSCRWKDGKPKADYYQEFQACTWKYTENGYFFIEEYHPPGYDGAIGQTGFRVKPLDKKCRELNRKYVMPVGYELNKLLITDWNENNYESLDFYDLFELMYRLKYGTYVPYEDNYAGAEYEVPKEEFEEPIKAYMKIESAVLEENAVYHGDTQTYRYRPRGLYDCESPYEPYPEVVGYKENDDGTIKLTINAVWTRKELDQAFASELVVRPLADGKFQYVSNHVSAFPGNVKPEWYTNRLTDEEWMEYYEKER